MSARPASRSPLQQPRTMTARRRLVRQHDARGQLVGHARRPTRRIARRPRPPSPPGSRGCRRTRSVTGTSSISMSVTTPSAPPPPPRRARNSSAVLVAAGAHERAVGHDDLERAHGVARRSVATGEPTEPAAEHRTDRPDGRATSRRGGEAVDLGGGDHLPPRAPGGDPRRALLVVDDDVLEAGRDEQHAVDGDDAAVTRRLHTEADAQVGGERHRGDDVTDVLGEHDHGRVVLGRAVPRQRRRRTRGLPA